MGLNPHQAAKRREKMARRRAEADNRGKKRDVEAPLFDAGVAIREAADGLGLEALIDGRWEPLPTERDPDDPSGKTLIFDPLALSRGKP